MSVKTAGSPQLHMVESLVEPRAAHNITNNNQTGWNMVEDARGPVFIQRPHATNPRPPPLALSERIAAGASSSASSSSSSSPTSSPRSPRSPRSPSSSSIFGALSRMHSSSDLSLHKAAMNVVLPKETPVVASSTPTTPTSPPTSPTLTASTTPTRKATTLTPRPRPFSVNFSQPPVINISPRTPQLSDPEYLKQELQEKSTWTAEAMKTHPDILEIIERVRSLNRAASFGRLVEVSKTRVTQSPDDILGRDTLVQLIMQHLNFEGLKASRKILEDESHIKYMDYQLSDSRLVTLMRLAIKDTEKVWGLTTAGGSTEETQKLIEEYMRDVGLLPDKESAEIWDDEPWSNVVYVDEKDNIEGLSTYIQDGATVQEEKLKPIKAASLNQLVIALTPEKLPDLEYLKTFMLTYQSFTTPAKLLQKLIERYHVPRSEGMTEEDWKKVSLPIQARVGNVLRAWIRDHWSDFTPSLIQSLKSFIDNTLRLDGNLSLVRSLTTTLNAKLRPEEDTTEEGKEIKFSDPPPEPKVPKTVFSPSLQIMDVDEEEIARQLTLVDFELYAAIKPSELLNQAWNKPNLKHRSPNLLRAILHFNDTSAWVATTILKVDRIKERARIMAKFVRMAEYTIKTLSNFNSAMAILSGLNASSVHRLKFTREEMPKSVQQSYAELQTLLSSNASYKEYRNLLSRTVTPCIPYLGVFLTDLTFIEDGNPDHLYGGLINFSKRRLVYNVIAQIKSFQVSPYNLMPVYQIACLLWNPLQGKDKLSETEQYQLSLTREPRNKDRSDIL